MVFLPDTLSSWRTLAGARSCSELYFLRHAIAVDRAHPQYKDDSLRPLTAVGRKKMQRSAKGMKALGIIFDALLSSPYVRARQTAEIVAHVYKIKSKNIYLTNNLLPPASADELLKEARAHFPRSTRLLFVGHEPHLTEMISCLLRCNKPLNIDFKKGGLCCLSILPSTTHPKAILNYLLTPAQLNLLNPDL